jgi:hypothetical protein
MAIKQNKMHIQPTIKYTGQTLDLTQFLMCSENVNLGTFSGITYIKMIISFLQL